MKQLLLAAFTLISIQNAFGQFSQDRFYQTGIKTIHLSMQSAEFDTDSVFVPYFHWMKEGEECYRPDMVSILGKEIRVTANGDYQFLLANDESLTIQSTADSGESWIAWEAMDGLSFVEASVSEIAQEDVLGFEEEVRTVSLQMLDENLEPMDAAVNNYTFRFGSESGLIGFPSLLNFPEFVSTPAIAGIQFDLVLEENGYEYRSLTKFDIYDYQPGDQIHIEEGSSSFGEATITQYKEIILSRIDYPDGGMPLDSIVYSIEVQRWTYSGPLFGGNPQPFDTTIVDVKIEPDSLFDLPAGSALVELSGFGFDNTGTFSWLSQSEFGLSKSFLYNDPIFSSPPIGEDCFSQILDWGCSGGATDQYVENLGGPYFYCSNGAPFAEWRELVYYNTSSSGEWGEPLNVFDLRVDEATLEVFPNPVRGEFRISNDHKLSIQRVDIFDTQGRMIKSFNGNIFAYDISDLDRGIYLVVVNFDNSKFGTKRIVFE